MKARKAVAALALCAAIPAISSDLPEALSRDDFEAGMNRVKPRLEACGRKSAAKGKVEVQLTVAPAGNVRAAKVLEAPDKALGNCVAGIAKTATFARSRKGGANGYSISF